LAVSRPVGCGSFDCVVPDGYGFSLLGAQLAAVAGVFWPGEPRWRLPRVVAVGAAALLVGGNVLAAAGALGLGRSLRPLPHLPSGATLRTDGAFGVVQHPIYAGLLLASTGAAVLRARPEPLAALAVLAAVLHLKAGYEERLLRVRFGAAYDEYAQRVPRMVLGIRTTARRRVRRRLSVGAGARGHT
jgi:protein-S-isoprenylcysteine O-methyltransferase Ste14